MGEPSATGLLTSLESGGGWETGGLGRPGATRCCDGLVCMGTPPAGQAVSRSRERLCHQGRERGFVQAI